LASFALDTSCMVAAVCGWHEHHAAATAHIEQQFDDGAELVVPGPALVEAYAVLTRLPPPHRLSPADAWAVLDANFVEPATIVTLADEAYPKLLRRLAREAIAGGRTYDAVIADCAQLAGVGTLLTFNRRHFEPPPEGVTIIDPSAS
jgi:predicted nucleic acid-binding protein